MCLRRVKRKELTTSTIGSVQSPDAQNVREAIRSLSLYPQYYQRQRDFESDDEESEKESEKIIQPPPSSYGTLASVGANIQDNVNKKCCSVHDVLSMIIITLATLGFAAIVCIILFMNHPSMFLFFTINNL
jgi:hypothetical protein